MVTSSCGVGVLGSVNLDVVAQVERLPRTGETLACLGVKEFAGGKGANQAVAAARMGVKTRLCAALGQDSAADQLRTFLTEENVDLGALAMLPTQATGRAFITVDAEGENVIVVDGGANLQLKPEHLPVDCGACRVLLGQLETPIDTLAAFFAQGAASSTLTILNAAPAIPEAVKLFALADVLIVNETEFQAYAQLERAPAALEDLVHDARALLCRPGQTIIVTLGPMGAAVVTARAARMVAARKVKVVDTTGAGDCFCGVLAAFLSEGEDLWEAVAAANAAAALAVGRPGAASAMPTRAELQALTPQPALGS